MVAPALIAGLGIIISGIANAVLGKGKTLFSVVRTVGRTVVGKTFDNVADAEKWQETLSKKGKSSIIVQRVPAVDGKGHSYVSLHPVQGMAPAKRMGELGAVFTIAPPGYWLVKWRAPGSTKEHLEVFQFEREAAERERDLSQMAAWASKSMIPHTKQTAKRQPPPGKRKMGSFKPPFDTKEEQESMTLLTTRWPSAERFQRARKGPYPETENFEVQKLTIVPEFDDTTSSHEWKSSVIPAKVPTYDDSEGHGYSQPEMLVVEQRLQDPG